MTDTPNDAGAVVPGDEQDIGFVMRDRMAALTRLREQGVEPFAYSFERTHNTQDARALLGERDEGPVVRLAGRIASWRSQGKTAFANLVDQDGRLQLYLRRDELGEEAWAMAGELHVSDVIGVSGPLMRTRTGEVTVRVTELTLLAKALRPLPFGKEAVVDSAISLFLDGMKA